MRIHRWTLIVLVLVAGCASPLRSHPELLHEQLPFIHDGQTLQQALIDRLGVPTYEYEKGRIIIYGMRQDSSGGLHVIPSTRQSGNGEKKPLYLETYNLVLVFRVDGTLERHALLRIK